MSRIGNTDLKLKLLLCSALLLRAVIPAGFMPVAAADGRLFGFCPEGAPAGFLQVLTGGEPHDHDRMGHGGNAGDSGHDSAGDHRCPLGLLLLPAAAVDDHWQPHVLPLAHVPVAVLLNPVTYTDVSPYRSRGPPA